MGAVKAPDSEEPSHANDHDNRSRHCQSPLFQIPGVCAMAKVVIRRQLKRRYVLAFFEKLQPCLVGIEACASSTPLVTRAAGTWPYRAVDAAGLRQALRRNGRKNDAADAEVICLRRSQEPMYGLCQSRRPSNKAG